MGMDFSNDYAEIRVLEDVGATIRSLRQATRVRNRVVSPAKKSMLPVGVTHREAVPATASKLTLHCIPFVPIKN